MSNKIIFSIKSNWFDKGKIKELDIEGLWVYINIRKFVLRYMNNICAFSIDELYKEIQRYYKENYNKKYSKPNLKNYLFKLKKFKIINFDRKYNMKNSTDLVLCALNDLPNLDDKYKPISEEDYFITIDFEMIEHIFNSGLNENHVIVYYLLKKYINADQITISYDYMSNILNIDKNSINKYSFELEQYEFIANQYTKLQNGHIGNNFLVSTDKTYKKDENIKEVSNKNNIKRLKKKLQNKKIMVTEKAIIQQEKYLKYMTEEESKIFNDKKEIHIVYAIEYLYLELLDKLKEIYNDVVDITNWDEVYQDNIDDDFDNNINIDIDVINNEDADILFDEPINNNPLSIFDKVKPKSFKRKCIMCGVEHNNEKSLCDKCMEAYEKDNENAMIYSKKFN